VHAAGHLADANRPATLEAGVRLDLDAAIT